METGNMTDTIAAISGDQHPATQAYYTVRKDFKAHAANETLSPSIIANFVMARVLLNQDEGEEDHELESRALTKLMRSFTPISNAKKLANGRRRWDTLNKELTLIEVGQFSSLASIFPDDIKNMMKSMAARLKTQLRANKFTPAS